MTCKGSTLQSVNTPLDSTACNDRGVFRNDPWVRNRRAKLKWNGHIDVVYTPQAMGKLQWGTKFMRLRGRHHHSGTSNKLLACATICRALTRRTIASLRSLPGCNGLARCAVGALRRTARSKAPGGAQCAPVFSACMGVGSTEMKAVDYVSGNGR